MKLVFAVACLAASLSLATNALAQGPVTATLAQPVAKKQFVVNGAIWDCEGTSCVAYNMPGQTFGPSQCHDVAKHAGLVTAFKNDAKTLQQASLDVCNTGLVSKSITASR